MLGRMVGVIELVIVQIVIKEKNHPACFVEKPDKKSRQKLDIDWIFEQNISLPHRALRFSRLFPLDIDYCNGSECNGSNHQGNVVSSD